MMFGLNAWRAGRLRVDAPWIIGGVLVAVLALVLCSRLMEPELISADIYRLANRALALALAGLWHWRLRPSMRAQELTGSAHPRAWLPALASILIGVIASAMLANQLGLLRR